MEAIDMKRVKPSKKSIVALIILLIPVLLVGASNFLFATTSYKFITDLESGMVSRQWIGDYDGVLMTLIISSVIIALWLAGLYTGHTTKYIDRFIKRVTNSIRFIKRNPKKVLRHIGFVIAVIIISVAIEARFAGGAALRSLISIVRVLFYATVGGALYFIVIFRSSPEKLFLSLSLLIGFLYVAAHPPLWYGWDNEIHYARAVEESFVINVSVSEADYFLADTHGLGRFTPLISGLDNDPESSGLGDLLSGKDNQILFSFRKGTDTLAKMGGSGHSLLKRLVYIPAGIMIFIGRSLVLAPVFIVKLGTLGNHLMYTAIVYLAIKRLNTGKHLLAVIAMFPTAFVLSTTFGYDHWVTAFIMLGFAYYFNELQNPKKKIELKNIAIMVASFIIGLGPKAIYVPLMLILYFIKKNKFRTLKGYRSYIISVTCAILLITASFIIPFLSSGGGGDGDFRGGSDVNAASQTQFILSNPLAYAGILLNFLWGYLNIYTVQNYVTYFAHLGNASFFNLIWILVGFVALTDRSEKDTLTSSIKTKTIIAFLTVSTVALISTALYVDFTGVGSNSIAGMSGRYLIPVVFPFLYAVGSFKIRNYISKSAYSSCVFGIISFVLLFGAWEKFINILD